MTDILIENIGELIYFSSSGELRRINSAYIHISDGLVKSLGEEKDTPDISSSTSVLNAENKIVTPGLIDSHTHLIFAGSRENEFRRRVAGETYLQIAEGGGGILSTVQSVRESSLDELINNALPHLNNMLNYGTTTAEVKSGYGLDTESELRMLEAIHILNKRHPVYLIPTFLGAHSIPEEFRGNRGGYIKKITDEMIPAVSEQGYARFCDVFCDEGAFTVDEMKLILKQALKYGLKPKAHLDEFRFLGGVQVACELGAVSVEHLTKSGVEEIEAIAGSNTVAVLLPATTFHLGSCEYAKAREFLDKGCEVAIASDFNPGSAFSESLQASFIIASSYLKMLPEEIIRSTTLSGAKAIDLDTEKGLLNTGTPADLVIWDVPNIDYLMYHWGINQAKIVIKNGEIIEFVNKN
jgi:imidazolonepropionase